MKKKYIADLIAGSESAFCFFFNEYYQGLLRFTNSYVDDPFTAENIVQDAFMLLWEKRAGIVPESNVRAFLLQVVKLKAWNYLNTKRRRLIIENNIHSDAMREINLKLHACDAINTSPIYMAEIETIIEETLAELPKQTRLVFNMSRKEFLMNNEIAEKLEISVKGVEFHITKALKVLKTSLANYLSMMPIYNL